MKSSTLNRQQIQNIPGALRRTLEKAHAEFGAVVRQVRWGDGPLYVCGEGDCADLGVAASYAFETFPAWPVVARPVTSLQITAPRLLRPRSVLLMISCAAAWPEALEFVAMARQRDCIVLALTNLPDGPLANVADHVLLIPVDGGPESPPVMVCLHATLNFLAFEAARLLKRPQPQWDALTVEFDQLPDKLDWMFTQLTDVIRTAAAEMPRFARLRVVGAGFNHYPAMHAARRMRSLSRPQVECVEASDFLSASNHFAAPGGALLLLSGSESKMKKLLHRTAVQARAEGARVLSLTDSNDRDLVEASDLAILVPALKEAPSSTLAMFVLECFAMEVVRAQSVSLGKDPL